MEEEKEEEEERKGESHRTAPHADKREREASRFLYLAPAVVLNFISTPLLRRQVTQ